MPPAFSIRFEPRRCHGLVTAALIAFLAEGCAFRNSNRVPVEFKNEALSHGQVRSPRTKCINRQDSLNHLAGTDFSSLQPEDFSVDIGRVAVAFKPQTSDVFRLMLLADIQITDSTKDFGALTKVIDKRVATFRRNFYQDYADVFYAAFMFRAIRLALDEYPDIQGLAHLGDAIHDGRKPELEVFNELVGEFLLSGRADWTNDWKGTWLESPICRNGKPLVPYYNILGNHDLLYMGTFDRRGPIRPLSDAIFSLDTLIKTLGDIPPFKGRASGAVSVLGKGLMASGYYSRDHLTADGKKVRLILLNTNERNILDPILPGLQRGTLYPSIGGEQFDWLQRALNEAEEDAQTVAVFVFGHNQLAEISVNRTGRRKDRDATVGAVRTAVTDCSKVKAYFSGHLHAGGPAVQHLGKHTVPEFVMPSLQEFPKSIGVLALRKDPVDGEYRISLEHKNLMDCIRPAIP